MYLRILVKICKYFHFTLNLALKLSLKKLHIEMYLQAKENMHPDRATPYNIYRGVVNLRGKQEYWDADVQYVLTQTEIFF